MSWKLGELPDEAYDLATGLLILPEEFQSGKWVLKHKLSQITFFVEDGMWIIWFPVSLKGTYPLYEIFEDVANEEGRS